MPAQGIAWMPLILWWVEILQRKSGRCYAKGAMQMLQCTHCGKCVCNASQNAADDAHPMGECPGHPAALEDLVPWLVLWHVQSPTRIQYAIYLQKTWLLGRGITQDPQDDEDDLLC